MLHLDPIHDFGERWWNVLLKNEQLHTSELQECRHSFSDAQWINRTAEEASYYFSCVECKSPLIRQEDSGNKNQEDIIGRCVACGSESEIKPLLERALSSKYFREIYEVLTRGGELPLVRCPECRFYTLVLEKNECAACGHSLPNQATWCETCRNPISEDEQREGTHRCPAFFNN